MCGIVGSVSRSDVIPVLLDGLMRLEYRGYDSAGLVVIANGFKRVRTCNRVQELRRRVSVGEFAGRTGIAHTRWATHGEPTEANAHPHSSRGLISVVHNGIVENHQDLRMQLQTLGYCFASDTDTEVIPHLIHLHYLANGGDLVNAVRSASSELKGTYAIAVIAADSPGQLVCARQGSPLVLGLSPQDNFCASDVHALTPYTRNFIHMEDGDVADLCESGVRVFGRDGVLVVRPVHVCEQSVEDSGMASYRHFMHKEIHEQARATASTVSALSPVFDPAMFGESAAAAFAQAKRVTIVACGTSYHAGLIARHWLENLADIPCDVGFASETRYRTGHFDGDGALWVLVSQSGETADTLGALHYAREHGVQHILSICNVPECSMMRLSDLRFMTRAGPEIGVASTKAFTAQLVALYGLAVSLAVARGRIDAKQARQCQKNLLWLPQWSREVLSLEPAVAAMAQQIQASTSALFIGRGLHYPVALEGALKLKEISYIHAEAYPAGELKHGPLALVSPEMPVIALVPDDELVEKMKSAMQEVRARKGKLFVFADRTSPLDANDSDQVIVLPGGYGELSPVPYSIALQLLAYHVAVLRGNDVDKPRNLAKSVTVE